MAMKKLLLPKTNYTFLALGLVVLLVLIEVSIRTEISVMGWLSSLKLSTMLRDSFAGYLGFTFVVLPLLLFELMLPNDEASKDHHNGVFFWILSIQCNYFFSLLAVSVIERFHIHPAINLSFKSMSTASWVHPLLLNVFLIVLTLLIFDFFYYWFHRMQHTIIFFWEFHKVHHSIKNLNSIVSYHHLLEELFRIPFITIPLAFLISIDAPRLAILSSFFAVYGQFIHMNSRVSLGPARMVFADNYYHRIHHSIQEVHYNRNFAAFFPLWDIVFRTACFPKKNEFPQVGLVDMEQPKNLKDYLFSPRPFGQKMRWPFKRVRNPNSEV